MNTERDANRGIISAILEAAVPYPVRWPNSSEETPTKGTWLRGELLTLRTEAGALGPGGRLNASGVVEFRVYTPVNQEQADSVDAVDVVRAAFAVGSALAHGRAAIRIRSAVSQRGEKLAVWYVRVVRVDFFGYINRG